MKIQGVYIVNGVILWYSLGMNLEKEFKKSLSGKAFFYVTLDPERAMGIEDILPNYTIICPFRGRLTDSLRKKGVGLFILEDYIDARKIADIIKRGSYGLLQNALVKVHINKASRAKAMKTNILILKTSNLIEDLCKREHWTLLAPRASVAEKFENKVSQFKLLRKVVAYPKSTVLTLEELLSFDLNKFFKIDLGRRPQAQIVLQFNRGHSGNNTFFIKPNGSISSPQEINIKKLYKLFPRRQVKISEYIQGKTYTLNCLALRSGKIITGSISEQITGLAKATNNPSTTVGNDFSSAKKIAKGNIEAIRTIASDVGGVLYKKGYRGLFGIDVIIEKSTKKVYFIELNTHQPASIPFEAKLHRRIKKVPLLVYFILGVKSCKFRILKRDLAPIILPIPARPSTGRYLAKQIIYRNKAEKTLSYDTISKKYRSEIFIARMKFIKPNEEIYRRQYIP